MEQSALIDKMETALCTPAWPSSEFHQLFSWTSLTSIIPGLLAQCCPLALPSREAQFYCKCCTHKSSISSLERKNEKSPEMFPWNHELQGWVISHLKTEQSKHPHLSANPLDFGSKPITLPLLPEITSF